MGLSNFDFHTKELFGGNILMILCSLFYLAWWIVAFKPTGTANAAKTYILFIFAALSGLAGLFFMIHGINTVKKSTELLPGGKIVLVGLIAYVILFLITYFLLKRQVTTELLLIVGWAVLEISVINVYYGINVLGFKASVLWMIFIGIAVLISMYCYLLYYHMDKETGYIDGMIPLITVAIVMTGLCITTIVSMSRG